ncbi:hypothetical protein L7F22_017288 [Adiantum nelumboides]|nr:hypothetical protein [Adiantum nelumboides]
MWNAQEYEGGQDMFLDKKLRAALMQLHNVGEIIFFPPVKGQVAARSSGTDAVAPVIIEPSWFCNKVIGELLSPQDSQFGGRFEQPEIDVKLLILQTGCPGKFVDEILRYIQRQKLCFVIDDKSTDNSSKGKAQINYFFPAVARNREMHWPFNFNQTVTTSDSMDTRFYGRRIKCKETEKHLLPSGVFARLQVKLQVFYGVGNR